MLPRKTKNGVERRTRSVRPTGPRGRVRSTATDRARITQLFLGCKDSRTGMADDVLGLACRQFLTTIPTKPVGNGLGLSKVYGFARQSGGDVLIKSVLGQVTSVTLYLPRARVDPAPPMADVPPETWARGEAIFAAKDAAPSHV